MDVADTVSAEAMAVEGEAVTTPEPLITSIRIEGDEGVGMPSDHTSSDYYFDSYAHFGERFDIHQNSRRVTFKISAIENLRLMFKAR